MAVEDASLVMRNTVAIVVGEVSVDLQALAERMPVWAPNSPENKAIYQKRKKSTPEASLTLFKADDSVSPEDEFLEWLSTVDLHHGEYTDAPWDVLEVYGAKLTEDICAALTEYGVNTVGATAFGFRASRRRMELD